MKTYVEQLGGEHVGVQLAALDDVDPRELISAPIRYADGRNNEWGAVQRETRHL